MGERSRPKSRAADVAWRERVNAHWVTRLHFHVFFCFFFRLFLTLLPLFYMPLSYALTRCSALGPRSSQKSSNLYRCCPGGGSLMPQGFFAFCFFSLVLFCSENRQARSDLTTARHDKRTPSPGLSCGYPRHKADSAPVVSSLLKQPPPRGFIYPPSTASAEGHTWRSVQNRR